MASAIAELIASASVRPLPAAMRSVLSAVRKSKFDSVAVCKNGGTGSSLPRPCGESARTMPTFALTKSLHHSLCMRVLGRGKAGRAPRFAEHRVAFDRQIGQSNREQTSDERGFRDAGELLHDLEPEEVRSQAGAEYEILATAA